MATLTERIRWLGMRHATMRRADFTPDMWFPFALALVATVDAWPVPVMQRAPFKVSHF